MHFRYWVLPPLPISAHCHPWKRINQSNFSVNSYPKHCRNQAVSFPSSPAREPPFASPEFPSGITFRSPAYLGGCSIPPLHLAFPSPPIPSSLSSSLVSFSFTLFSPSPPLPLFHHPLSAGLLLIFLFLTFSLFPVILLLSLHPCLHSLCLCMHMRICMYNHTDTVQMTEDPHALVHLLLPQALTIYIGN